MDWHERTVTTGGAELMLRSAGRGRPLLRVRAGRRT